MGETNEPSEERFRWRVTYGVSGDLRFISHHDTLRLFQRALARARIPVRYSEGFNPRPRMSIPLPRPVGIASDDDVLVVETTEEIAAEEFAASLGYQTPDVICVKGVCRLFNGTPMQPKRVRYRIDMDDGAGAELPERIQGLLANDVVSVERRNPKKATQRTVNIRPFVEELVQEGDTVVMTLSITPEGTAKPAEVASQLGYDSEHVNHLIRRLEIQWQ